MKKLKTFSSLLFALLLWSDSFADQVVRISNISDREKNCYPSQLQEYLGKHYEVRNFGVSGCTALTKGDRPYIRTTAYQALVDSYRNQHPGPVSYY